MVPRERLAAQPEAGRWLRMEPRLYVEQRSGGGVVTRVAEMGPIESGQG